jgi:dihydrofolate synthase/folylpolyglutamate synthase
MSNIYQVTLDYLYSFVDFSMSKSFRYSADKFNLERIQELVSRLDHPQKKYPCIHIAGTKGKGSVAAFCQSVLIAAGYKVGLYTSPHLHDYAERIKINGESIPHEDLISLVDDLKPVIESIPELTTFEITTALAFVYFARQNVDAAVIEVGLGGRLDATNVVIPRVSVITSLSFDHTFLLGNTLAEIAREKGGIIKPGVPVVLAPQKYEARAVIEEIALDRNSPLIEVGKDYLYQGISRTLDSQTLMVWSSSEQRRVDQYMKSGKVEGWEPTYLNIPLLGSHQTQNAAVAYAALRVFKKNGLEILDESIYKGFLQAKWAGRFEILQQKPPVIVDSAHNRDSALKLRQALDDYFPGVPVILVFGASEDKDIDGMLAELMPRVNQVVATKSFHPRAIEPEAIVEIAGQYGKPARIVPDVADALLEAIHLVNEDQLVLATGSIFIAAGAREAWFARMNITATA